MKRPKEVSSSSFINAIRNPKLPTPEGLRIHQGSIDKRYAIYRNNVTTSLIDALAIGFPVIQKLVGEEFFHAMAIVYVRLYPPETPLLMQYGKNLPKFLHEFEPVSHLKYLPDIATLEIELRNSFHAADNPAFDSSVLQSLPPEEVQHCKIVFGEAVRLLSSEFPIASIWRANIEDGQKSFKGEEFILITRREFDPIIRKISKCEFLFLKELMGSNSIKEAVEILKENHFDDQLDVGSLMQYLVAENAITCLQ